MKQQLTPEQRQDLVKFRLELSDEALADATRNNSSGSCRAAINRIYYACFYSVTALLTAHKHAPTTHSGAKALLGEYFVRTGRLENKYARFYSTIFNHRSDADYGDFVYFESEEVEEYLDQARSFIAKIKEMIE